MGGGGGGGGVGGLNHNTLNKVLRQYRNKRKGTLEMTSQIKLQVKHKN